MPEILNRDLSRPDGVCLCLWRPFAAAVMLAANQKQYREEEKDAATHSLFLREIKRRDWHKGETPSTPSSPGSWSAASLARP